LPHFVRLHQWTLFPGLHHHDRTGSVAANRRRRPTQENIEETGVFCPTPRKGIFQPYASKVTRGTVS
jgi:hypothetical protein